MFILIPSKTFRARLVEVIDQAQHFAALGPVGAGGSSGDSAQAFREGLDSTERESELWFMEWMTLTHEFGSVCVGAGECEKDKEVV